MDMTHLPEDDLVLHYYGELPEADESRVAGHLRSCAQCHADYRRLQQLLAAVPESALSGPELPPHFERTVWARLEPALPPASRGWLSWMLSPARLAWTAAVALLVVAAFMAGRMMPVNPVPAQASNDQVRERILLVDLSDHLDRSQRMLVELVSADDSGPVDITGERNRAEDLVAANRLYRQTAAATGDAAVLDLLDQLERVLVDVAASPSTMTAQDLGDVRRRIESGSLIFKVRVVSSDLQARQKAAVQQRTGQRSSL